MSRQSCPTLCNTLDYSLPGSSVHGILQARILERGCHPILQRIFPIQEIKTTSLTFLALAGGFFTTSATWEACYCVYGVSITSPKQNSWLSSQTPSSLLRKQHHCPSSCFSLKPEKSLLLLLLTLQLLASKVYWLWPYTIISPAISPSPNPCHLSPGDSKKHPPPHFQYSPLHSPTANSPSKKTSIRCYYLHARLPVVSHHIQSSVFTPLLP